MTSVQLDSDALPSIVLLVDRDATTLAAYSATFETAGMWATTCSKPDEALDAVYELRPDLVVTDAFDDGEFDLVARVKDDPDLRRTPVILLTGRNLQGLGAARLADLCLQKPISGEQLVSSGRKLIARSHELRQHCEGTLGRAHQLVKSSPSQVGRACPQCAKPLGWVERGRLLGIEYDYYRWCANGCGLYCYELRTGRWIKLA